MRMTANDTTLRISSHYLGGQKWPHIWNSELWSNHSLYIQLLGCYDDD